MDNQILLERINKWQERPALHELTCGNNSYKSKHELLKAELKNEKVVLVCPTCGLVQEGIPNIFYHERFDEIYNEQMKIIERFSKK
jgi:uncharacterized Zn finger protein